MIQLITPHYYPEVCATGYLYHELCQGLVRLGHMVTVITGSPRHNQTEQSGSHLPARQYINGVEVLRARVPGFSRHIPTARGIEHIWGAAAFFIRAVLSEKPDVILVHSAALFEGLTAMAIRTIWKIPFVLNVHDLFPQTAIDLGLMKNRAVIKVFRQMEKYIYRKSNWITTHSPGNRKWVISMGGDPCRNSVMPIWMDTDKLYPGPQTNTWQKQHNPGNCFTVIYAGTQGYNQDLEVILKAAGLLTSMPDIRFIMIGKGAQHKEMVRKSREMNLRNIKWLGWQPRDQYPMVMHTADVVLATLKKEVKTPVVASKILSAMSAGRPVIACMPTDGDGPEILRQAGAGIVIPAGHYRLLADSVRTLYRNKSLARQLGRNGRRFVIKHLDVNIWARKYENLFSRLMNNRP